jgi:hypothetical protein
MKTKIGILVLALSTSFFNVQAQQRMVTTARATSYDISDNLDLDAVASIFGDSENLEEFERKLNDPNNPISNLDLNDDGYIDYLRVVENSSDRNSLVVIQAVLDDDVFQDVATIEIERINNGNPRVQIVGDDYIYGSNYIIEPVFYRTPLIFSFFWGPRYSPWQSPYYWNYYPRYYSNYRPCSPFKYRRNIYAHINYENKYRRADSRNIHFSGDNYSRIRRDDFANRHPDRAFQSRNEGVKNRYELNERRPNSSINRQQNNNNVQRSNDRQYQNSRQPNSVRTERQRDVKQNIRPAYQEKSGSTQTQPRQYNGNSNRNRTQNNGQQIQQRSENRNQSFERRSAPEQRSVSTPQRSTQRVESPQRSSAPRERSGSVTKQSSPTREVKQSQRSTQKTESTKKEDEKENENGRRR